MKITTSLILLAFLLVPLAGAAENSALIEEIKAIESLRLHYQTTNDLDKLVDMLCDTLVYTHSSGKTQTKVEFLDSLRSGDMKYLSINHESLTIQPYGDTTVILTGTTKLDVISKAAGHHGAHLRFILVYVKEGGQWKVAAWQSTKLEP